MIVIESANFNPPVGASGVAPSWFADRRVAAFRAWSWIRAKPPRLPERAAELIAQISGRTGFGGRGGSLSRFGKAKEDYFGNGNARKSCWESEMQTARVKKILESLGFSVRKGKGLSLEVAVADAPHRCFRRRGLD